jgi:TPR repeat protein
MSRRGLYLILTVIAGACLFISQFPDVSQADDYGESEAVLRENLLPARQGDSQAQVFVGYLYETGQGVQQDFSQAAQWYWKAAEQGNPVAQFQLGNMYHLGKGVTQNYVMAYMWLDLAASRGNANAREIRRVVATKMDPAEIAEAKRMAEEWKPMKR